MTIAPLVDFARKILTPTQVCWLCLLGSGTLYSYAVSTFATNNDVKAISIKLTESTLFDLRTKQCEALRREQPGVAYAAKIREVMREYRELTGGDYSLPDCREL